MRAPSPPPSPISRASRTASKTRAATARCASSTIPRRPTPTPRSARWSASRTSSGFAGGKAKDGGIESLKPHFARVRKAYLIGEAGAGLRQDARRPGALRTLGHAGACRGFGGRRCARVECIAARGSAVAGLCLVRPVPRFRAARRCLQGARRRRERPSRAGGVMIRTDRSGFGAWWWTIDRVALFAMLALIAIGLMLAFAASPAAHRQRLRRGRFPLCRKADRLRRDRGRHRPPSSRCSTCAPSSRWRALVFGLALIGCVFVLFTAEDVLGSRRWIDPGLHHFATFRIPQARFRRAGRGHPRRQGQDGGAQGAHHAYPRGAGAAAAHAAARCRADGAAAGAVGRAAFLLRYSAGVDRRAGRQRRCPSSASPISRSAMCATASTSSSIPARGASRPSSRSRPSPMAGSPAFGPGAGTVKYKLPYAHSDFVFRRGRRGVRAGAVRADRGCCSACSACAC